MNELTCWIFFPPLSPDVTLFLVSVSVDDTRSLMDCPFFLAKLVAPFLMDSAGVESTAAVADAVMASES